MSETQKTRKPPLRWRRHRHRWSPDSFRLCRGDQHLATVAVCGRDGSSWYWYGLNVNTALEPVATVDEAKAQALAHVKKALAEATR